MSKLAILTWPAPALSTPCEAVSVPGDATSDTTVDVARLVTDMFETMYDAPGRGLAAPQVGVSLRLFVMDAGWKHGDMTPLACLNPVVRPVGERVETGAEGCLSMPGVLADVSRPAEVTLTYTDLHGARHEVHLTGDAARIAQHETDHLDGIMHFHRLSDAARRDLLAQWESQ